MAVSRTHVNHRLCGSWLSWLFSVEWLERGQPSTAERRFSRYSPRPTDVFNQLRATLYPLARLSANIGAFHCLAVKLKIYLAGFALTTTPGKAARLRGVLLKPLGVPHSHSLAAFLVNGCRTYLQLSC